MNVKPGQIIYNRFIEGYVVRVNDFYKRSTRYDQDAITVQGYDHHTYYGYSYQCEQNLPIIYEHESGTNSV